MQWLTCVRVVYVLTLLHRPPMDPRSDKPFYFAPLNPKLAQTRYTAAKAMLADQVRGMVTTL